MPGYDHQHHAGCHHGDRRSLDRQIPQIAWRQEGTVAIDKMTVQVKAGPDQQQRADHTEQAGIDFGGAQEADNRALFYLRLRIRQSFVS